jgi:hypothetical protein
VCSPIQAGRHQRDVDLASIRWSAASRFVPGRDERVVGQGRGPAAGDGVLGDRHPDFTTRWGTGSQDLDEGDTTGEAEDQA